MNAEDFGTALIATARKDAYDPVTRAGAFESAGPNTDGGGFVDQCQAEMGLPPGNSWCACAVCKWVRDTATTLSVSVVFHRSASALRMRDLNPSLLVTDPRPGDIVIWDHTADPAHPQGHVGILTEVVRVNGEVSALACIAGNTSADGKSRNGDRCAEHDVSYPDPKIVAFLRITPVAT